MIAGQVKNVMRSSARGGSDVMTWGVETPKGKRVANVVYFST